MSTRLTALPTDVDTLIDTLDAVYPERCIRPEETEAQAQRRAGARDVINHLILLRQKNTNTELEKHRRF